MDHPPSLEVHADVAEPGEEDGVVNDGEPYENSYAWVLRMENGKVVDGSRRVSRHILQGGV